MPLRALCRVRIGRPRRPGHARPQIGLPPILVAPGIASSSAAEVASTRAGRLRDQVRDDGLGQLGLGERLAQGVQACGKCRPVQQVLRDGAQCRHGVTASCRRTGHCANHSTAACKPGKATSGARDCARSIPRRASSAKPPFYGGTMTGSPLVPYQANRHRQDAGAPTRYNWPLSTLQTDTIGKWLSDAKRDGSLRWRRISRHAVAEPTPAS